MQIPTREMFEFREQPHIRRAARLLLLVFVAFLSVPLRAQSAAPVTLVKAARLLDPRTGNVLTPAFVLIEGNKIKQVGSSSPSDVPAAAKIIDLGAATLLPYTPVPRHRRTARSRAFPSFERAVCSGHVAGRH